MQGDTEVVEWRVVPGWPRYVASSDGRVRAHEFILPSGQVLPARDVSQRKMWDGYIRCRIYGDGRVHSVAVHRLVALAFHPNPEGKPMVNHRNGVKHDNRAANLEWATGSENARHARATGLQKSRISQEAWVQALVRLRAGEGMKPVARDLGVSWQAIQSRLHRSGEVVPRAANKGGRRPRMAA